MNLSENTQGKKLLVMNCKNTEFCLNVTENSEIIKNPIPILWNFEGMYGWVPVEVVKNEIANYEMKDVSLMSPKHKSWRVKFTWYQTYRLRQDVGRMLEELANE